MTKKKWAKSDEKKQLRKDILDGVVTDNMMPKTVYNMHEGAYHVFSYENFRTNLKNLRVAVQKSKNDSAKDKVAFENVLRTWQPPDVVSPPYPDWHNSVAKNLLLQDIQSGDIANMKTKNVWQMRPEYMVYPLPCFRDHLNKEKTKPTIRAYWEHQKELKSMNKKKEKHG
jgi:ribosomal protein S17